MKLSRKDKFIKSRKNKFRKTRKNRTMKGRNKKGGAPERISVESYTDLNKKLQEFPNDSRIWIVKKGENNALYESNKNEILESLFNHGITNDNINNYDFNVL